MEKGNENLRSVAAKYINLVLESKKIPVRVSPGREKKTLIAVESIDGETLFYVTSIYKLEKLLKILNIL